MRGRNSICPGPPHGCLAPTSIASPRSAPSIRLYPPIWSLVSANGPSDSSTWSPRTFSVVASLAGRRPTLCFKTPRRHLLGPAVAGHRLGGGRCGRRLGDVAAQHEYVLHAFHHRHSFRNLRSRGRARKTVPERCDDQAGGAVPTARTSAISVRNTATASYGYAAKAARSCSSRRHPLSA